MSSSLPGSCSSTCERTISCSTTCSAVNCGSGRSLRRATNAPSANAPTISSQTAAKNHSGGRAGCDMRRILRVGDARGAPGEGETILSGHACGGRDFRDRRESFVEHAFGVLDSELLVDLRRLGGFRGTGLRVRLCGRLLLLGLLLGGLLVVPLLVAGLLVPVGLCVSPVVRGVGGVVVRGAP